MVFRLPSLVIRVGAGISEKYRDSCISISQTENLVSKPTRLQLGHRSSRSWPDPDSSPLQLEPVRWPKLGR